jgi:hypothetical protein
MTLGSMALLTGKFMGETWRIPDWEEQGTESSLRDSAVSILAESYKKTPN